MTAVEEFAPAKVNLTLHVTGRRADGYHLLDSLVSFADVGDRIVAAVAPELGLTVTGRRAVGVPTDGRNLVLQAAGLMNGVTAALTLDKHLPAASGIGGGSADAAATLRALSRLTGGYMPSPEAVLGLGADVPVCLHGKAVRMQGVGERLSDVTPLPPLPAVLVNPGVEVATPAVFAALDSRDNAAMPTLPEHFFNPVETSRWIAAQRNDLESPAISVAPAVASVLNALRAQSDCLLARMSGSGATCFGLFPTGTAARAAAEVISAGQPEWWVAATTLG
ncbi:4-(cytidine 5'-diphospho)-2-C-methyl-D-erythritol kinase [Tropicimonas marinistellae]|uniref:4-(cytidine 5'-diphospho)-2-C-methyl-D-erythritol kinase n=1 Tax=Tropicimonas marinistellae TaxID=1739787 RepID=UPI00082EF80D|nr:4-(cytidine 5'-diphospho)-2-C-methyl-D-erythritol kinase [Tropicimonas marinistellae]